ncbi:MAG TPA: DUF305 domain-containing protein [Gemmatimonadaceae bacterium]
MRSEPSAKIDPRSFLGALVAAGTFVVAHAALLRVGKGAPWSASLAFAATDGLLWFVAAPLAMALGRRLGRARGGRALPWQLAIGAVAAPLFGAVQGAVSVGVGRAPEPALASAFWYLDLNVAVLVLAAVALDQSAARIALARQSRRFLALEARLLEVRHDFLNLQLQPHFLFNALNSVVELMRESPREAARVLRDLRTLFLATTQRSSQVAVSLAEELSVVDAFIGVARARHADALSVTREVDEAALTASVPPLSLQPLVENAIQFALQSEAGARSVSLLVRLQKGRLYIRVTNSRSQRDRPSGGLGIGLKNTRERLTHLFGRDHALTLTLTADRAIAELDAPFVPLEERSPEQRLEVTDEFAAVANPLAARTSVLPRWIGALPMPVAIVGFWTLAWLFWVFQIYFSIAATKGHLLARVYWSPPDLVSAISWMALTPVPLYLARRFPVQGPRRAFPVAVHVVGALGAAMVNVGSILAVFGLNRIPLNNILNQVVVNCAIYALLVVLAHAEPIARWFDERQTATRRLQAELARARWEATEMRLSPEIIARELERLATLVELDTAGAEDDVLDMADALRRRLKGSDSPAQRAPSSDALRASVVVAIAVVSLATAACTPAQTPAPPAPATVTSSSAAATAPARPAAPVRAPNEADVNFITGMIGHHAQALVMAGWAPSHGANASVRVLCERIINEQHDEIATMQTWLRDRNLPVPEAKAGPMRMKMNGMEHEMLMPGMLTEDQMKELDTARDADFDRLFLKYMIQHHQGAVTMVLDLFDTNGAAQEQSVYKLASDVQADQTSEITRMQKMLASLTPGVRGQ